MNETPEVQGNVSAKQFTLLDNDGKTRAVLAMEADRSPALKLFDENGVTRMKLQASNDCTAIRFYDSGGEERMFLNCIGSSPACLSFSDSTGAVRMQLYVDAPPDKEGIFFKDDRGNTIWSVPPKE